MSLAQAPLPATTDLAARARRIHAEAIVLDTHIDTTQRLMQAGWDFFERHEPNARGQRGPGARGNHLDYPRMREGGLDGLFFSIYMAGSVTGPTAVKRSLEQIDAVRQLTETRPDVMVLATTAAEIRSAHQAGKIATMMGMEGGHMIDDSLRVLRDYARLGVRYLTLTHSLNTTWGDSSGEKPAHHGLTAFGKDVVRELNRLGVMVDVSHVADKTFEDALATSRAPLLASHSSCRALTGHARNMTDDMIKAMAAKGGVIQINYLNSYIDETLRLAEEARRPQVDVIRQEMAGKYPGPENAEKRMMETIAAVAALQPPLPVARWERIVDHIDHAVKIAGVEHVGLGSDFDGASMPDGMEDVTRLPKITEELLRRGYTEAQIKGILGENLLRLMEKVEAVAKQIQAETPTPRPPVHGGRDYRHDSPGTRAGGGANGLPEPAAAARHGETLDRRRSPPAGSPPVIALDTGSLVHYLAGSRGDDVETIDIALVESQACLPPVVLSEILSDPKLSRAVEDVVLQIPILEPTDGYWERVGRLHARVMRMGQQANLADALIAQSCLDHDVPLVTRDGDFQHFRTAGLRILPAPRR